VSYLKWTWPGHSCLRNVVAMFHVLEKEMAWRKSVGKAPWPALETYKPIVAMGAAAPLAEEQLMADYFRMTFSPCCLRCAGP